MVHELAGEGMLILWSTSYLDEAEQCRDVLLMNEGELLYQGEPKALTQTMAGRSFLMTSPHEGNRKLLQRALKLPQVSDGNDLLVARGETLELPKGCTKLYFLAASTAGDRQAEFATDRRTKTLTIHSMAELPFLWDMAGLKQTARIKDADIALEFTHCHHPEGNIAAKKAWFYLYELDIRGAKTLTLPEDNRLIIMAMTAVKKYANTALATPMLDTVSGDYDFDDIPPMEKLIDKADFVTIRAGKIQDQAKGGKGKGWKRDNPITNIIRSYTKSEW